VSFYLFPFCRPRSPSQTTESLLYYRVLYLIIPEFHRNNGAYQTVYRSCAPITTGLECFSRQDPYDSARCIYQRQDSRQCQKAESHRLACQVMMQFAREVIFANSAERRIATICRSATDIVEHRCLIIIVRLRGHTASVRSRPDQTISMINLEHWFQFNSCDSSSRLLSLITRRSSACPDGPLRGA
jgi:hypothetical protein